MALRDKRNSKISILLIIIVIFGCVAALLPKEVAAATISCPNGTDHVNQTIGPNGANWQMCVGHISFKGMMLSQITLTPPSRNGGVQMTLLESVSLGAISTLGDKDATAQFVVSATNGVTLAILDSSTCPNGTLLLSSKICMQRLPRGYAWRGFNGLVQGESLVLFAVSMVGSDCFIQKWVFDEEGSIHPLLGVSGPLATADGRFVSAIWRFHFTLNDFSAAKGTTNTVEEMEYDECPLSSTSCTNIRLQKTTSFKTEASSNLSPETQRFWRIVTPNLVNGNGIQKSLEINTFHTAQDVGRSTFLLNDFYVTEFKSSCENFAANECSSTSLNSFLNGETLTDPVVWVTTTRHQTHSTNQIQWQGLDIRPRDLTTTSPLR